jgi:hypothetical protein
MPNCHHDGFHSGQGRYDHQTESLRYVVVCDGCESEIREVEVMQYRPEFAPHGNDAYVDVS